MSKRIGTVCLTDGNAEVLALKRKLVADEYSSAHSCCHCQKFVVPETLLLDWDENETFFKISMQIDEIHRLAAEGCLWFALFSKRLNRFQGIDSEESDIWHSISQSEISVHSVAAVEQTTIPISIRFKLWFSEIYICAGFFYKNKQHTVDFCCFKQPDGRKSQDGLSFKCPINTNPATNESIQLVCSWLKACSDKHECGIERLPLLLPTLLLAIGKDPIHLINTTGKPKVRYVALSYCWGVTQKTLLSRKNKQQLLKGIVSAELDNAIQEAIHVTRQIGFEYLWIDSLCIIQGDKDGDSDKEITTTEIARMDEIYHNATLTLIPSRAASVQESFLSRREAAGSSQSHLIFKLPHFNMNSPLQDGTVTLIPTGVIEYEMKGHSIEPWSQRAWTLQESIVSRRRLQFGLRDTTWTCCNATVHYVDNDRLDSTWFEENKSVISSKSHDQAVQIVNQVISCYNTLEEIWDIWTTILQEYSRRRIKYQDDRLPAIASIAKGFAQALKDDYVCGLWRSDLYRGLLWHEDIFHDVQDMSEIPSNFQPSWSWVSSRRAIYTPHESVFKDSDFEFEYNLKHKIEGDKYGAVESATLHIRALIASVPEVIINDHRADILGVSKSPSAFSSDYRLRGRFGFFESWDQKALVAGTKRENASRVDDLSSMLVTSYIGVDNAEKVPSSRDHYPPRGKYVDLSLLIVGHHAAVRLTETGPAGGPCGLLIARNEDGTYRRIGYFEAQSLWGSVSKEIIFEGSWCPSSWTERTLSNTLDQEYRSRVLYLWGGESSLREIALV
ncbi:HET-domain-containing protein [Astrocystis sublimbata]|nr:HET-domain-containing protein [Astrocystis sublimbata]